MSSAIRLAADVKAVLGEGPVWVARDQALYWLDIKGYRILRLCDEVVREWPTPVRVGSIAPRVSGGFIAGTDKGFCTVELGDDKRLKAKIDEGADFVLTQLFFDNNDFFEFREFMVKKLSVNVPICPGILPILSTAQIKRFTTLCGAQIPSRMMERLEQLGENDEAVTAFGIEYATRQCEELLRNGAPGIHFYTLNKVRSTTQILKNLGLARV